MADLQNRAATIDVEATISRLRGVVSTRVVTDSLGDIVEIHVVADESRHPKQLSRDIESALFSALGLRVDHRKISIAQIRGGEEPPQVAVRLKFLSIDYSVDRTHARVRVSVGLGQDSYMGTATAPAGPELDQEELVARATVEAVQEYMRSNSLDTGAGLELGDFCRSQNDDRTLVLATVRVLGGRTEDELLGSAIVRDDPWKASSYAVLDALNRRLKALSD